MIRITTVKTKCDAANCKNNAAYCFEVKGRNGKCFLCKECFFELTHDGVAMQTPKSPQNAIKRALDSKREEESYGKE
ncbi:MAG: hypothetical protein NC099_04320 [Corallococcus sp.]|nr:hypothetical protein [Corallococcus sp.]